LAQKGEATLTSELADTMDALQRGVVPNEWLAVSYPTLKPLASYIKNLNLRLNTFQMWVNSPSNHPLIFWISGFFST